MNDVKTNFATRGGRPGGQVVGYSKQKRDACPDCKGPVESVLTGGGLAHSCKACGGNMESVRTTDPFAATLATLGRHVPRSRGNLAWTTCRPPSFSGATAHTDWVLNLRRLSGAGAAVIGGCIAELAHGLNPIRITRPH